ncbi:SusD family [Algoriella xinjiangensis]|uniref:RagB/SusD family nutrient uptake outer membrane protein n=1 Tax=Algoriella xinjiangensis TaxID=684065 RepID=UPI000F641498|nr:RagB/SusD family nutrient uptake outer membrane protein [Algoriella xinjiangensis]VDH15879.1 SusD family [Algoriella xinjiangensis]
MKKIIILLTVFAVSFTTISCDSLLDIEPDGKIIPKTVADYRLVLTSAYAKYPTHKSMTALRTDEITLNEDSGDFISYRETAMWKDVNPDQVTIQFPWVSFYTVIFYTNQIITEGQKTMETSPEKDQLLAEAYALRAYAYFDLVNLFGKPYNSSTSSQDRGVPLNLEIDLEKTLKPSTVQEVYNQINTDLAQANTLMILNKQPAGVNYRFSKAALHAFEARTSLYQNNWKKAKESVDKALTINNKLADLNTSQLAPNHFTSPESILALDNTLNSPIQYMAFASNELLSTYDASIDKRFPIYFEKNGTHYKVIKGGNSEFKTSFRVAELYFIKAESLLKLNQLEEAKTVLSVVLKNRYSAEGLTKIQTNISKMNASVFMNFILEERVREFALEGQRWYDLRRANQKKITHQISGKEYILQENDVRYTIEIPQKAKLNNPYL